MSLSSQFISLANANIRYTPFEILWIPNSARLVVVGENPNRTGTISLYRLKFDTDTTNNKKNGETLSLYSSFSKSCGFKCATFGHWSNNTTHNVPDARLATGNFEGTLNIWDLDKPQLPCFQVTNAHDGAINCIDGIVKAGSSNGAAELVTGSHDGVVRVWDPRTQQSVAEMRSNTNTNTSADCWTVCFGNSYDAQNRMIAAGYDNGDIKILDLRTNKLFYETNVNSGVCCIQFDCNNRKLNKIVVTSLQSYFRVYDLSTHHISQEFPHLVVDSQSKSGTTIWRCCHLPQNRDIWVTCAGDGCVNCWQYTYPQHNTTFDDKGNKRRVMGQIQSLTKHNNLSQVSTQPIVSWDWNKDKTGLACVASLDQKIHVVMVTDLQYN